MQIGELAISGYRSIRSLRFPLQQLTVLVGGNGAGKTNLYRSLELLQAAANGRLSEALASEGGLTSAFWAGELRKHEKRRLSLEVKFDALDLDDRGPPILDPTYSLEVGFPPEKAFPSFPLEAVFKSEKVTMKPGKRAVTMMERRDRLIHVRDENGANRVAQEDLLDSESALGVLGTSSSFPELVQLRQTCGNWRFYHKFRTDAGSPLRQPTAAITSPLLSSDGSNLAAVFATLRHIREDSVDLDAAIDDAFPGSTLRVPQPEQQASFTLTYPDFPKREFSAAELSDGTLQYLSLMGALLSYRLPPFMALNEPENSLHNSVLPALGRLIAKAAERTQILVVTHSNVLAEAISDETGVRPVKVVKQDGETWLEGLNKFGQFEDA